MPIYTRTSYWPLIVSGLQAMASCNMLSPKTIYFNHLLSLARMTLTRVSHVYDTVDPHYFKLPLPQIPHDHHFRQRLFPVTTTFIFYFHITRINIDTKACIGIIYCLSDRVRCVFQKQLSRSGRGRWTDRGRSTQRSGRFTSGQTYRRWIQPQRRRHR